jgi:polyhydroxyalkanoate synthase
MSARLRKDAVYTEDKTVLYRFKPMVDKLNPVPLLIVYALVNRPYMADLQKNRSLVRGLFRVGWIYLIDWGYPDSADRFLTLDDYINGYIDRCCARHKLDQINILGICQGGTFSLCYSVLHPDKAKNLITTVTPVDFHTPDNVLNHWMRKVNVDLLVDTMGNIPGEMMNSIFLRRAMEGRRPRREARDSPEGALSHCVSLRASDSEVAQVSAGRSRQKESLAASPRAPGGLGCPVAQS